MIADGGDVDPGTGDSTPPTEPVEPGPYLWRTLRAHAAGDVAVSGKEALLYTDSMPSSLHGKVELGALSVQHAVGSFGSPRAPAARIVLRWWEYDQSDAPLRPGYSPVVDDARHYWLGMSVDEESAALLSLLLGVRMRSGGVIRWYRPDDLVGRTDFVEHVVPVLAPRRWSEVTSIVCLPVGGRGEQALLLDDVLAQLIDLRLLSARDAVTVVRAAKVFSDALWVCEHDPELAWLHLVTALELAADRYDSEMTNAMELFSSTMKKAKFAALEAADRAALEREAEKYRQRTRSEPKLHALVAGFPPAVPLHRPMELPWTLIDWDDPVDLQRRVATIYAHRSARLHGGVQFPAPLLQPGLVSGAEHPGGADDAALVWHAGGLGWSNAELPLSLDAFAHLTRSCLLAWWKSLTTTDLSEPEGV